MLASVLTALAGVVSIVLWWLNTSPARRRRKLLAQAKQLKVDYADAIRRGDGAAAAQLMRRLRELEAEAGGPAGE